MVYQTGKALVVQQCILQTLLDLLSGIFIIMLVETLKMLHYFGKHLKVRSCQIRTTQMTRKNLSIPSVPRGSLWCDQCVVRHYNAKTTLPSKMASLSLVSMPWWQLAPWVKSTKITLPKSQNMVTIALPILWPWFFFLQR